MTNPLRLWVDDLRPPPAPDWLWAKDVHDAKAALKTGEVKVVSLDHDLGDQPWEHESGYDLVQWMCYQRLLPEKIVIHSWNPAGARRMARLLSEFGRGCIRAPYREGHSVH